MGPPIPSEIVLPVAGSLSSTGRMSLLAVLVAATAGAVLGAALLHQPGRWLGPDRSRRLLARLPLVAAVILVVRGLVRRIRRGSRRVEG